MCFGHMRPKLWVDALGTDTREIFFSFFRILFDCNTLFIYFQKLPRQSLETSNKTVFNLAGMFFLMFWHPKIFLFWYFSLWGIKVSWCKVMWMRWVGGWSELLQFIRKHFTVSAEWGLAWDCVGHALCASSAFLNRREESYKLLSG